MSSLELKQYFEHFVTIGLFSSQLVPLMLRFLKAGFLWHRWAQCPLKEFFRALSFKRVLILLPTPADPISQFFLNEAINILLSHPTLITLLLHRHRAELIRGLAQFKQESFFGHIYQFVYNQKV